MLGQDEHETDTKNRTSKNLTSELTNTLEMVKKNMSGFGIAQFWSPRLELAWNYDVVPWWAWNRQEKSAFNEFSFWAHEPLIYGKKLIQAFESLNYEVWARSLDQITILGTNE